MGKLRVSSGRRRSGSPLVAVPGSRLCLDGRQVRQSDRLRQGGRRQNHDNRGRRRGVGSRETRRKRGAPERRAERYPASGQGNDPRPTRPRGLLRFATLEAGPALARKPYKRVKISRCMFHRLVGKRCPIMPHAQPKDCLDLGFDHTSLWRRKTDGALVLSKSNPTASRADAQVHGLRLCLTLRRRLDTGHRGIAHRLVHRPRRSDCPN